MFDYPKYGCAFRRGRYFYFWHNTGMQNQYVLYRCHSLQQYQQHNTTSSSSDVCEILNPNRWSEEGLRCVTSSSFTEDGSLLAYAVADKGSDWNTIYFARVLHEGPNPIEELPDVLQHARFTSLSWTHDNIGIFYNTIDAKGRTRADGLENDVAENHKLFYHRMGTPQSEDILVCSFPEHPAWMSGLSVSHDGRYLLLSVYQGCEPTNQLWYCDMAGLPPLSPPDTVPPAGTACWLYRDMHTVCTGWVKLINSFNASYEYVTNYTKTREGDQEDSVVMILQTNRHCDRYKLVSVELAQWVEDIQKEHQSSEQSADEGTGERVFDKLAVELVTADSCGSHLLDFAFKAAKDLLVVHFFKDVKSLLQIRCMYTGELIREFPLGVGTVATASGNRVHPELLVKFTNFLTPSQIFYLTLSREETTQQPELIRDTKMPGGYGYDIDDFVVEQVFYESKDGKRVPMFVVRKTSAKLDGSNPTLLYGYGGFSICENASFSISRLIWVNKLGGIFALANIRGGGEYGKEWHYSARRGNRQVAFDDFQSAAKYLIDKKYTQPDKLAIQGGSNGGLLVTACMLQQPHLYRAVVADVPVTDLLRFHKFTAGQVWKTEYGDPDEEKDFNFLRSISPLHTIPPAVAALPSLLVTTSDHDDRVSPLHSLKFIATLRHDSLQSEARPHMLRVETSAGHGGGKPTEKVLEESAERTCFLADQLEMNWTN
eukprot:GHVS01068815.1.p1 GENE.GHVS01068815.1~~GHVS01068815.1.p1  ORF type:complete len:795 (-),score=111.07 GHVS01068815.1:870-3008(-)